MAKLVYAPDLGSDASCMRVRVPPLAPDRSGEEGWPSSPFYFIFPLYAAFAKLTLYCLPIVSDSAYSTLVSAFSACKRDTHRLSRWFFSCGPKGLACQLRLPALVRFTLANYFPLPVNGSSKFSVSCSLISSSSSWFCIYFRIFPSFFPTVLT